MLRIVLVVVCGLALSGVARAQDDAALDEDPAHAESARTQVASAPPLGPTVTVEEIVIRGNTATAGRLIRRALLVEPGDSLQASDPRFRASQIRVLGLGYFSAVDLRLEKGSARGRVILVVEVVERGTLWIHQIYLGTSEATPIWAGLDLGDVNFLGSGIALSAAAVWADEGDVPGARSQQAYRLRYADPSIMGSALGTRATLLYNRASEPFTLTPGTSDAPEEFDAANYERTGGSAGITVPLTRFSRLLADARYERVTADALPAGFDLEEGTSHVVTAAVGVERDTRSDPVLPYAGTRMVAGAEVGVPALGSDYSYLRLRGRASRWWPVRGVRHVVSLHLGAGAIVGDAPRFDRFYVGDWNRLNTPRAAELLLSTRGARNLLDTTIERYPVGDVAGSAELEYSYRLFSRPRHVYGGNLFVAGGVMGVGDWSADGLPVDLILDVGLRLDTEIGIFEIALGNALGRVPL